MVTIFFIVPSEPVFDGPNRPSLDNAGPRPTRKLPGCRIPAHSVKRINECGSPNVFRVGPFEAGSECRRRSAYCA